LHTYRSIFQNIDNFNIRTLDIGSLAQSRVRRPTIPTPFHTAEPVKHAEYRVKKYPLPFLPFLVNHVTYSKQRLGIILDHSNDLMRPNWSPGEGNLKQFFKYNTIQKAVIFLVITSGFYANFAQSSPVSTQALINSQTHSYSRGDLQTALASEELKAQLEEMGVDTEQLNDRVASLTPDEIIKLNTELEQQPAGGVVSALATIFVVLVVTDMMCATNVFAFVKCVN
jgi:hypothetical protein